jgi:DMSO reductase anchor subunit
VPQYSSERGIVRKCDMCSDRLAEGEAPACVQACPNEAIKIKVVDIASVLEDAQSDQFLPAAPSPGITVPTTRYASKRALPKNLLPADFYSVRSGAQHMPLVVMLVLTQLAVGAFVVDYVLSLAEVGWASQARQFHATVSLGLALLALVASVFHLGRPQYAFRAILGFKTSWLSREILAFGGFVKLALVYAGLLYARSQNWLPGWLRQYIPDTLKYVGPAVVALGLLGVFCSAMVYGVTHRRWWAIGRSNFRFFATAIVLGLGTTLFTLSWAAARHKLGGDTLAVVVALCGCLAVATLCKLAWEISVLMHLRERRLSEFKRTALLLSGALRAHSLWRLGLGALGGIVLPIFVAVGAMKGGLSLQTAMLAACAWLLLLGGELFERALFFRAVSVPRMPGAIGS